MSLDKVELSWSEVDKLHKTLAHRLATQDIDFEICVAIMKGGLPSATHLSYLLDIPSILPIGIRSYNSEGERRKESFVYFAHDLGSVADKNVLIVDSAMGTGDTLKKSLDLTLENRPNLVRSVIVADWVGSKRRAPAGFFGEYAPLIGRSCIPWPVFPWE